MSPGEIYWADLESGRRPIIVVSRESLNRDAYVVAVPLTTASFDLRSTLPNCLPISAGELGLARNCVAQCEAITLLDNREIDEDFGPIGTLDAERLRALIRAVGYVMEAECEPS